MLPPLGDDETADWARNQTLPPVGPSCQLRTGRLATNSKMKQGRQGDWSRIRGARAIWDLQGALCMLRHTALQAIRP
jgi:hypothetical protein